MKIILSSFFENQHKSNSENEAWGAGIQEFILACRKTDVDN